MRHPRPAKLACLAIAAAIAVSTGRVAIASAGDGHDPSSVFLVAKNQNRNQVHYGIHVDASCNVIGTEPLYGYWRMIERGGEIEPILAHEIAAYGVDPGQRIERDGAATIIRARLNAAPDRSVIVTVKRIAGRCEARARTSIGGADADLRWIYVRFLWPMSVDYILLHGRRVSDGTKVEEKI